MDECEEGILRSLGEGGYRFGGFRSTKRVESATGVHPWRSTWRYNSHTLREGIADYIALKIFPGAAVGPNPGGDAARLDIPPEAIELLGTTKPAPEWVSTDPLRRRAYYFASYRFVRYLIEQKDMETFWKLYTSENPEMDFRSLYGLDRKEAVQAALEVKQ